MFVTTVVCFLVGNHLKYKCCLVSILCGHNHVCMYAYLCEFCIMGSWPLCTINFLNSESGYYRNPRNGISRIMRLFIYGNLMIDL